MTAEIRCDECGKTFPADISAPLTAEWLHVEWRHMWTGQLPPADFCSRACVAAYFTKDKAAQ